MSALGFFTVVLLAPGLAFLLAIGFVLGRLFERRRSRSRA